MNKNSLFSLFILPLVALPIGLSTLNNSNKHYSLINKSLNINESTIDNSINLKDALPVADSSITSFGDYIVSYEDNNISPVNTIIPSLSNTEQTNSKAGGATIGMTASKQTITLTTYAGLLLWSHKLIENQLLKNYYSTVKSVNDISGYKVINFAYLESKNILFVLFGNETTANNTTTLSNLVVFGLDINSGAIVVPKNAKLNDSQVIAKARDNSAFIFFNSSDQLIVTSGNNLENINKTTKIMNFDIDNGFSNVENKGNDEETNNFSYTKLSNVAKETDYLLAIVPSSVKGVNFSIWMWDTTLTSANQTTHLSYAISNSKTNATDMSINQGTNPTYSFTYYIVAINDNFTNILDGLKVINTDDNGTNSRGFINNTNKLPDFNSIYKRFFSISSSTSGQNTSEKIGVLLDSYDEIFSSFAVSELSITNGTNPTVNYGATKATNNMYMNYLNASPTLGPKKTDLDSAGLEDNVVADNWKFNTVAYDKESKFVYFSLSSEEYTYSNNTKGKVIPDKFLTNTRYIDLNDGVEKVNSVSSDAYETSNPYTLSDVNIETYIDNKNIYLAKQVIDANEGQWLSTPAEKLNDDTIDFVPTGENLSDSKIEFSSLKNFESDIENSKVLDNVMPSAMNENLTNLDKFLTDKGTSDVVKFISADGDDTTGEISLEAEITYPNNFGDGIKDNGKVSYFSYLQVVGFQKSDFSLTFKENTDSAVIDIKEKYSAEKIVQDNNKGFVINHFLQNFTIKGEKFIPESDTVTLKNVPNSNDLTVEIDVPIKTSPTDEYGVLPFGFPEKDSIVTITYSGFTGTEAAPIENYPGSTTPNQTNWISDGGLAGIVIGCLALAAIIVSAVIIVIVRMQLNKSFKVKK